MILSKLVKTIVNWLIILLLIFLIGYIGFRVYNAAVENLIIKIRREVSSEVVDTFNPFKWPGKIFGHRRKKSDSDHNSE